MVSQLIVCIPKLEYRKTKEGLEMTPLQLKACLQRNEATVVGVLGSIHPSLQLLPVFSMAQLLYQEVTCKCALYCTSMEN